MWVIKAKSGQQDTYLARTDRKSALSRTSFEKSDGWSSFERAVFMLGVIRSWYPQFAADYRLAYRAE